MMQRGWRWIVALTHWMAEAWRVWGAVGLVVLVAFIGSWFPGNPDDRVRYCGLVLELLGIFTVVSGLRDKQRIFNRPGLLDHVLSWLASFPRWRTRAQTISLSAVSSATAICTGKLSVWRGTSSEASVEARLTALEANIETLKSEHAETSKELQEAKRKMTEAVTLERLARESADRDIRKQLETLGAGSLHLEAAGLFWLILGVIFSTVPAEVAKALAWLK